MQSEIQPGTFEGLAAVALDISKRKAEQLKQLASLVVGEEYTADQLEAVINAARVATGKKPLRSLRLIGMGEYEQQCN
jgi:hypothetical protein